MNIKEIATFPVQLEQVETLSIQAEKYSSEVRQEFSISASVKGEVIDKSTIRESTGKSTIEIKVCNDDFSIEEKKVGIFKFQEEITDEEAAINFMEVQGIRILWSYVREDFYTVSSKMLLKPIMIPTIDVMKTLEKAQ